jgi:hypothetical protein
MAPIVGAWPEARCRACANTSTHLDANLALLSEPRACLRRWRGWRWAPPAVMRATIATLRCPATIVSPTSVAPSSAAAPRHSGRARRCGRRGSLSTSRRPTRPAGMRWSPTSSTYPTARPDGRGSPRAAAASRRLSFDCQASFGRRRNGHSRCRRWALPRRRSMRPTVRWRLGLRYRRPRRVRWRGGRSRRARS